MVWIKCEAGQNLLNDNQIGVTKSLFKVIGDTAIISFGQRSLLVKVKEVFGEKAPSNYSSFKNPIKLLGSIKIFETLLVQMSNVYQLKYEKGKMEIGPVIGLFLGDQQYYYHNSKMGEYTDALSAYEKIGGLVYTFKSCSIDWLNHCIYGMYFDHADRSWKYRRFPFPSVIYRRAFNVSKQVVKQLKEAVGGKMFNTKRYNKWELYQKLNNDEVLRHYLPETARLQSLDIVKEFLTKYSRIILKPTDLSRGRGICIMQKINEMIFLRDYQDGTNVNEANLLEEDALRYIQERQFFEKKYIIQPYLDLVKINGSPWDIRVVMQKETNHKWECHGIECRVAGKNDLVTNISRGGTALPIAEAIKQTLGPTVRSSEIKKNIIKICKLLSKTIESEDEVFAELGIDIALDVHQNIWIIESNVRPTYNGFKRHMDYHNYLYLCSSPIIFASSLAGFKKGEMM